MKVATRVAKVDLSKCIGCRSCEAHCVTGAIKVKKADNLRISPCRSACPAGIDIPGYISLVGEGRIEEAYRLIRRENPLPSVCGRICTHPCQTQCNRKLHDDPVGIMDIKRFATDTVFAGEKVHMEIGLPANGKSVAVIGAGPSGLSCAYYLALNGYKVRIYEASSAAGGVLYYGIPQYRLPKDVLNRDIDVIKAAGVEIILNTEVGKDISFDTIRAENDAVYIATGAQFSKKMGVKGEDLPGVYHGLDFLRSVAFGKAPEIGDKVVVIGGGNTAMDAARTAKRLGAKNVTILYRRRFADMPADLKEKEEAREEGIQIVEMSAPVEILGDQHVSGIKCVKTQVVGAEEGNRVKVTAVDGSDFVIEADSIIPAVSQYSDLPFIDKAEVEISKFGGLVVDETQKTSLNGVFSGGDLTRGPDIAITAVADGKRAAASIHSYLTGAPLYKGEEIVAPDRVESIKWETARKAKMPEMPAETRAGCFDEVALGLTSEQIATECSRCLSCTGLAQVDETICADCGLCDRFCPTGAVHLEDLAVPRPIHKEVLADRADDILEICTKAHMYPGQVVCFCYRTTAGEIASAILSGATTPEEVTQITGARSGCAVLCITGILRLLHAAAVEIGKAPGFQWYDKMATLWDVAANETVIRKWGEEYHILDDLADANKLYPGGESHAE